MDHFTKMTKNELLPEPNVHWVDGGKMLKFAILAIFVIFDFLGLKPAKGRL